MVRSTTPRHMKLTDEEVLECVRDGLYVVDTENGVVYPQSDQFTLTKPLCVIRDRGGSVFVRLFRDGYHRTISLALLVWMVRTNSIPPPEFEVHHLDKCKSNCRFDNLVALHHLDHDKYHVFDDGATIDRVPF